MVNKEGDMNIDRDSDFGKLEPLMLVISEHLKTSPDPQTNGSRYNKVWGLIFDYIEAIRARGEK